jgi:hypothetical protein
MITTHTHKLEQGWNAFTLRHNIVDYETQIMFTDGCDILCIETSYGVVNTLFDMEEQALAILRDCGLQLVMAERVQDDSIKLYIIPAA